MLNVLLESKPKRQRSAWGVATSAVLHGSLAALAMAATMKVSDAAPPDERINTTIYHQPPAAPPAPPPVHTARTGGGPTTVIDAPTVELPPLTLDHIPTDIPAPGTELTPEQLGALDQGARAGDLIGAHVGRGRGGDGTGVLPGAPYEPHMVDKAVVSVGGNQTPRYPEMLRQAGVEGTVLAQFVVDTLGHVDMRTFRALSSDHDLFTVAVRAALPLMRFLPAEANQRKVPQLVQMPFAFSLTK